MRAYGAAKYYELILEREVHNETAAEQAGRLGLFVNQCPDGRERQECKEAIRQHEPHTFMSDSDNQIPGDSKERVAFEMAKFIFEKNLFEMAKVKPDERKKQLFNLYAECLGVVRRNAE